MRSDVLVVGGGVAGLAAARDLVRGGRRVTLLEARPRLGGRLWTIHDPLCPLPVELGAEFVHGESAATFKLLREARLRADEIPDLHRGAKDGRLVEIRGFWEDVEEMQRDLVRKTRGRRDFSMADYGPSLRMRHFLEGFHAAPVERLSAKSLAHPSGSTDRQFRLAEGYDALVRWMSAGLDVRVGCAVKGLRWTRGEVVAEAVGPTGAPRRFRAAAAVVAIPAALLRARMLRFDPALPAKERAAGALGVGQVFRIHLRFREAAWPDDLNFLHAPELPVPVWWTSLPARAPLLTGWAGGPKAERLLDLDERARIDRSLQSLAAALRVPRGRLDGLLEAALQHDWRADPWSRGAYPYVEVGGVPAQKALAAPVADTLYFAGDALDPVDVGTVQGALESGRRAARALLRA